MKYWITHPKLTPDHDQEVEALALAQWSRSGWQIRDDQTPRVDIAPADPRPVVDDPAPPETPADDVASDRKRTGKKGS